MREPRKHTAELAYYHNHMYIIVHPCIQQHHHRHNRYRNHLRHHMHHHQQQCQHICIKRELTMVIFMIGNRGTIYPIIPFIMSADITIITSQQYNPHNLRPHPHHVSHALANPSVYSVV